MCSDDEMDDDEMTIPGDDVGAGGRFSSLLDESLEVVNMKARYVKYTAVPLIYLMVIAEKLRAGVNESCNLLQNFMNHEEILKEMVVSTFKNVLGES